MTSTPILPAYAGPNVRGIVPALLGPRGRSGLPSWFPATVTDADSVVLLVLDGLGWEQLQDRQGVAPTLAAMDGGPITTVAPSTTATALTSITTGLTPAEHGLIGYRVDMAGELLNVLRWSTPKGDARKRLVPGDVQPFPAFLGEKVPVVAKSEFVDSGFSAAHLAGGLYRGWRTPSNLAVEVAHQIEAGARLVYAYYDGIDKTAHERGFGDFYDAELRDVDRMVGDLLTVLPERTALLITADHGQVMVEDRLITPQVDLLARTRHQSGEGRFRWFHARPGAADEMLEVARDAHGDVAWVVTKAQVLDEGWFGSGASTAVIRRLGDVALVAREPVSFEDPADSGSVRLIGRHGSLTSAEMYVPLIAGWGTRR